MKAFTTNLMAGRRQIESSGCDSLDIEIGVVNCSVYHRVRVLGAVQSLLLLLTYDVK